MSHYKIFCIECKKTVNERKSVTTCPVCGGALDIEYDYQNLGQIENYGELVPLRDMTKLVSLGEGHTRLRKSEAFAKQYGLKNLYYKDEGGNPTGAFKDRGSSLEISKARELGFKTVCCASTGNMAASVAAYAAHAKLACFVVVPEGTPIGKLTQSMMYGAKVIQVRGSYNDCVKLCVYMAKKYHYFLCGDYVMRREGQKRIAYELMKAFAGRVPDVVIVPVGGGTNISALWKGFRELKLLGLIKQLPRMVAVQPDTVPTIVAAFTKKKRRAIEVSNPKTVASAVGIGSPLDDVLALRAVKESWGTAVAVPEGSILTTEKKLAQSESLFVEPAGCLPFAAIPVLLEKKFLNPSDVIVCIATGVGLKDVKSAAAVLSDPPVIEPDVASLDRYLHQKAYTLIKAAHRDHLLFIEPPALAALRKVIKQELAVSLSAQDLSEVEQRIQKFFERRQHLKVGDLQMLVEGVLKEPRVKKKTLEIMNFHVEAFQHARPLARVEVRFQGRIFEATADGVGPVDALWRAVREALKKEDTLETALTHFAADIDTRGTEAVVKVTLTLADKNDHTLSASSSSPDILLATMQALETAFNALYIRH